MEMTLRKLFALKCPKVLITVVLLLAWSHPSEQQYDVIEYFAGKGRVAKAARRCGLRAAALDVLYHTSFDITSAAGMALLGFKRNMYTCMVCSVCVCVYTLVYLCTLHT
ncbi:unnamed protein product [Symbiodinium sp. CCMP2592]|nr:unnamed protein product [Symbiodinium sp. CCMP2592]CAE7328851.1 unnamed protein product [Symbiodinium sp. CCMP2592]